MGSGATSNIGRIAILVVVITSVSAAQAGVVQPATAQDGTSVSIDTIPDSRIVAGEEFDVHVSGGTGCYNPGGATLEIYETDTFTEDKVGSTSISATSLIDSDGDFDTTVSATLSDVGDGEMELQARVEGNCGLFSSESARSDVQTKSIFEADSVDPDPEFLGDGDDLKSTLSVSGSAYTLDSESLEPVADFDSEINPGDEVTLTIYTENAGGNAGEFSTIQTQFPNFDASDDGKHIDIVTIDNSFRTLTRVEPGDTVYNSDETSTKAHSWQTEVGYDAWGEGATRRFSVTVTPQEAGEFPIYVRSTLTDDTAQSGSENKFTEPVSGVDDPDQDYQMEEITIPVSPVDSDDDGIPDDEDACPTEPEDTDGYEDDDGCPENPAPSVSLDTTQVTEGESTSITADATDPEGEPLTYEWNTPQEGTLSGTGSSVTYEAPSGISEDISESVSVTVSEEDAAKTGEANADIVVENDPSNDDPDGDGIPNSDDECNAKPEDMDGYEDDDGCPENPAPSVSIDGTQVTEGGSTSITADATDPEGEPLTYEWNTPQEGTLSGTGSSVTYEAPSGISEDISESVSVTVSEPDADKTAEASATVTVRKDSDPALFEVSPVSTTSPVTAGEVLEVTAEIKNTGETTETQSIRADAGALGSDSTSITLAGGESTTARFSLPTETDAAGDYTLTVRSDDTTTQQNINIRPDQTDPFFDITIIDTTSPTEAGNSIKITTEVTNTGDSTATQTVDVDAGPLGSRSTSVSLAGGATTTEIFNLSTASGDAGDYTATVSSNDDDDTVDLSVAEKDEPDDQYEPNDEFETAADLTDGTYDALEITDNDDDYFAITASDGESITASIEFTHAVGNLDMELYGPNKERLDRSDSLSDGESVSASSVTSDGTYYLRVYGVDTATASYDLEVTTEMKRAFIIGEIRNAAGEPIPNANEANITITRDADDTVVVDTTTFANLSNADPPAEYDDSEDTYLVELPIPNGTETADYTITTTLDQYENVTVTKQLRAGQTTQLDLRLAKLSAPIRVDRPDTVSVAPGESVAVPVMITAETAGIDLVTEEVHGSSNSLTFESVAAAGPSTIREERDIADVIYVSPQSSDTITYTLTANSTAVSETEYTLGGTAVLSDGTETDTGNTTIRIAPDSNYNESQFEIQQLDPAETTVSLGESFNVSATIENTGTSSDTQTIALRVGTNAEPIATQTLQLAGESTTSIRFENISAPEAAGSFNYTVATANSSANGTLSVKQTNAPAQLRVPDIPQTVQPEATFNVTYEVANAGDEFTAYTLQTTAATPNITVENFSGDIEASNPDAEPPGASTTGIDSGDTALVTVEYRVAANAAGTAKINVTAIEPLSQAQANSSRVVSISEAPTNPRERALQAAGKAAPSELSQNDVTAMITRFERGQSVNGISVTQNDVTATITLFERSTENTEATATNTETRAKTYLSENGANLYSGELADRTGQDEVTVSVGGGDNGFAFDKPGIVVSTGTTVIWEWTGKGGAHNIVSDDGSDYEFESEPTDKTGYTIEQTVDETGVALYVCTPHRALGMYGAVAVVDE